MSTFNLNVVTPTRNLEEMVVSYIRCPGIDGSFGIMANHQDGIFSLDIGEIMIKTRRLNIYPQVVDLLKLLITVFPF